MAWTMVADEAALLAAGRLVVRVEGRQILLVATNQGLFATANRCPHEGYPLSEGTLAGCMLTCNWHNWKFDLASGETLVGGDTLRRYPMRIEAGQVWLDPADPPVAAQRTALLDGLVQALGDRDQQRQLREAARLDRLGVDPLDAVRTALAWAHERLEYGTTHAFAAIPDWLRLQADPDLPADARLMALGEILGHIGDDVAGAEARFRFATEVSAWDAARFQDAIEREDEPAAVALLRGALALPAWPADLPGALVAAALEHYADFGHSLIYTTQALRLIDRLGPGVVEPVLLALVRALVYAQREDLLPEFRDYRQRCRSWWQPGDRFLALASDPPPPLHALALRRTSAKQAMAIVGAWAPIHPPEAIFAILTETVAWQLLHADAPFLDSVDQKLSENVGWLDFTHGLTFAAAGLDAVRIDASLWPALLLQLACFVGRNSRYVDPDLATGEWGVGAVRPFLADASLRVVNHGQGRFVLSAHLAKTLFAAVELAEAVPAVAPTLLAATNRFLEAPLRGRNPRRAARQMLAFVAEE
ncbi:MAG: Rieske (2Fe-2S) protein [Rhodospirillales bacterium]|nr:Rieske (2Fe-2S) protein [Rhodospirillales bacterium]